MRKLSIFVPLTLLMLLFMGTDSSYAQGSISGQFVLDGDVPTLDPLIAQGANVKDAAVCAAEPVPNQALVVDPKTKGIANVFIYLRKAPSGMPANLKESKEKTLVFDQKGCNFEPHAMVVRTDQTVLVKSDDPIAHNTHSWPLRNQPFNFFVKANDREGVKVGDMNVGQAEILPIKVTCDIHPWMKAYWLILDHPYAAISDETGKFTIEGLPEGTHEFRIWHESVGYVERSYEVTVKGGQATKLEAVKIPLSKFNLEQ